MFMELLFGLSRFKEKSFQEMKTLFEQLSCEQNPETLFITCSDSRIVPSLITQAYPGDLFTIRNIGNIIPPYPSAFSETAALEYTFKVLNIKDVIICGHSNCGAMKGLLTPHIEEHLPSVASWLSHSQAALNAVEEARTSGLRDPLQELEMATKKNIVQQMEHLKSYPLILDKIQRGDLKVHGWYYELNKGNVFIYDPCTQEFIDFDSALEREIESRKIKILSGVCLQYLQGRAVLKPAADYSQSTGEIQQLKEPLWELIKEPLKEQLWAELSGFYEGPDDKKFHDLVESCASLKLQAIGEFESDASCASSSSQSPLLSASIFTQSEHRGIARHLAQGLPDKKDDYEQNPVSHSLMT
ncbi:carbonic anhydrase [Legionella worsleiensis]|uniref:carbonic anhydrase n=1 Tax=Legionella worsleiensis TaxID=45076 RepID=A0A0W1AJJ0_9GAMM|nr:carbonic anhydrase [Legionella worsleiensis]KTD81505.1 (beta)-carbonic anhydrase [Legionella worsleiensis]STY32064.1 (beta)-carbonic anhydrase [Legionella worsleiensis]